MITGAELQSFLDIATGEEDAARLTLFAEKAGEVVRAATGRTWAQSAQDEWHVGTGTEYLVLDHYPVVGDLTTLTVDGVVLDVADEDVVDVVTPSRGIVRRTDGLTFPVGTGKRNVHVTYTGGPSAVPADLKAAALELAAWLYQTTGGRTGGSVDGLSSNLVELSGEGMIGLPTVRAALDRHRDVLK